MHISLETLLVLFSGKCSEEVSVYIRLREILHLFHGKQNHDQTSMLTEYMCQLINDSVVCCLG